MPESMLAFEGYASTGAVLIWVACADTWDLGDIKKRAMSGLMTPPQLWSEICDFCYHRRPCTYPGSEPSPEASQGSEGYAAGRVVLI